MKSETVGAPVGCGVVVGEGVDGLLSYTTHLLLGPGDALVTSAGTYPTLNYFVAGRGGTIHAVPYGADDRQDVDALVKKAHEVDAKILYLVYPDNPPGTWHESSRVEALGIAGLVEAFTSSYSDCTARAMNRVATRYLNIPQDPLLYLEDLAQFASPSRVLPFVRTSCLSVALHDRLRAVFVAVIGLVVDVLLPRRPRHRRRRRRRSSSSSS